MTSRGRHTRVVDSLHSHGDPLPFAELAARVLAPETRYLILDLDRTVHLGRNMGELLGWELHAYQFYGGEGLEALESRRERSRFVFDWSRPTTLLSYLYGGARRWAYPGLYYLLWGKVASKVGWLRRQTYLRFGSHPVRAVQRVPQLALMAHIEEADEALLRELAQRVWRRHEPDQVITKEDLAAIRERCPKIEILLSSASPRPIVEVAAEALGVDAFAYSVPERINSGQAKIGQLKELRADIFDPGVRTVGITDTGYGEDHCWAEHLTAVVDINSAWPFPAVVSARSPLEEVHSATVLSRLEIRARAEGDPAYLDPRRDRIHAGPPRRLDEGALDRMLAGFVEEIEELSARGAELAELPEELATEVTGELAFALAEASERSRAFLDQAIRGVQAA